jgi:hypothetical protein
MMRSVRCRPERPAGAGYAAGHIAPATPNHRTTAPRWLALRDVQRFKAAEGRDFLMHARIGVMRAINHGQPEARREPRQKRAKALSDHQMTKPGRDADGNAETEADHFMKCHVNFSVNT